MADSNTKIVYDALIAFIQSTLGDEYINLPDAYNTAGNDQLSLRSGFTVGFGAGINVRREISCPGELTVSRDFNLVLTQLAPLRTDGDERAIVEIQLLDDLYDVAKAIEEIQSLGGVQTEIITYQDDGGIEYLEDPETGNKYLAIVAGLTIDYRP